MDWKTMGVVPKKGIFTLASHDKSQVRENCYWASARGHSGAWVYIKKGQSACPDVEFDPAFWKEG